MAEGYKEDVVSIPTEGMDDARYASNSGSFEVPKTDGVGNKYPGNDFSVSNPKIAYEPGENPLTPTWGENDFPRQTGHDSLTDEEAQLS